jgi:threonine aldolase
VYVSLWKYFNSGIGAILAGPKSVLDGMFHVRRMFGGNLAVGWNAALVARHFMDGFELRLKSAVQTSETFYAAIAKHPRVGIERIPGGTNLARVSFKGIDAAGVARRVGERGIAMSAPQGAATVTFGVNETWNRMSAAEMVRVFEAALI